MKVFKQLWIVFAILAAITFTACYGPSDNDPILTGNGIIKGKIYDENGIGIGGVSVECEGKSTVSLPDGSFKLTNVPTISRNLVNFTKSGFASNQKPVKLKDLKALYVEAVMYPIGTTNYVNSANAFSISSKGAKVDFQANSLVDDKGNPYLGQATINLTYFDPTGARFFDVFPGEFAGIGTDGETYPIISYGFIDVEMLSGNKKLQLAGGKPATVSMPIPTGLLANAPSTIPLWHYDTEKGQWIEFGTASKVGNNYVGTVSHFSKINCDMKYDELSEVRGKVTDQNGAVLANALVKLQGVDFAGGGQGYTDDKGEFHFINVKANDNIKLTAFYSGFLSDPLSVTTAGKNQIKENCDLQVFIDPDLVSGWDIINAPSGYQVIDMKFINQSTGWILSNAVYRTDDGGTTWVEKLKGGGGSTNQDSAGLYGLFAINENKAWAVGSKVYYTEDGGDNWVEKTVIDTGHYSFQDVFFVNENVGFVIGSDIWKTTNAGNSWEKLTIPGQKKYFQNIVFADEMTGFVSNYGYVLKTTDGGATWVDLTMPSTKWGQSKIFILNSNNIWFLSAGREGDATVYFSNDGGISFVDKSPTAVGTLNDIYFTDDNNGWIAGSSGMIYRTTDGGNNWHTQFNKSNANLNKVFFFDNLTGWVAGSIGYNKLVLLYTSTGGEAP
jgi:photosystem II stability/assembly factor-like uncharacterized protein